MRAPVKVFRIDEASASVFAAERIIRGKPATFYTVTFSRSYRDADGKRRYTKSFEPDDLERIAHLCEQVDTFLRTLGKPAAPVSSAR